MFVDRDGRFSSGQTGRPASGDAPSGVCAEPVTGLPDGSLGAKGRVFLREREATPGRRNRRRGRPVRRSRVHLPENAAPAAPMAPGSGDGRDAATTGPLRVAVEAPPAQPDRESGGLPRAPPFGAKPGKVAVARGRAVPRRRPADRDASPPGRRRGGNGRTRSGRRSRPRAMVLFGGRRPDRPDPAGLGQPQSPRAQREASWPRQGRVPGAGCEARRRRLVRKTSARAGQPDLPSESHSSSAAAFLREGAPADENAPCRALG